MNTNTLEYIFSQSLKPTQHIGNHIKDNIDNKLNGMIRIWGKHGNFHRIEFSTMPYMAVQYGFLRQQRKLLESLQYQAAKITIRTKMNIPK